MFDNIKIVSNISTLINSFFFLDFAEKEYKPPYLSPEVKSLSVTSKILLRPQRVAVKYRNSVFPIDKSIVKYVKMPLCDVGLYFGRHFRIGWSKGLSLTCLSSTFCTEMVMGNQVEQLCRLFVGRKGNDFSPNVVNKLQLTTRLAEASLVIFRRILRQLKLYCSFLLIS